MTGKGTETEPFRSADGTAGIQDGLAALKDRGGLLRIPCGRYDLTETVCVDTPCVRVEGDVWAYNADPNGVFETRFGTKLRLNGRGFPALSVGRTRTAEGTVIRHLGIQGDIEGMDTRPLFDPDRPLRSSGLTFSRTRIDQGEFSKLSFCGLNCAVAAVEDAEIDACLFEGLNVDGCAVGMYFAPRAAYYVRFRKWVAADNPYYAVLVRGEGVQSLEIDGIQAIRSGGAFAEGDGLVHAAVLLDRVSGCIFRDNLIDDAGAFWLFAPDAKENGAHATVERETVPLWVTGHENRIVGNVITRSRTDAIHVQGDRNILMNNIADRSVVVEGNGNVISQLVLTAPDARLILRGSGNETYGVPEERIVRLK